MKKTTRTAKKVLSVFLSVLMILTTLTVAVPGMALAADGNKYYVKVYVNIYDGSDGYGGAYSVEESTGKPKNYSWATNDGWYGRINMTGFTVFGEAGDYDAQDVSAALLEAEKLNTYYNMSGLSDNNANGDWDSKAIAKAEYTFVLDSFPVEIFWMNDENNWDGGNTGFAIRKLTVATSENGTEHTMWEGLAGSDSETYNYYGSITPTGIHTCFEDYAKNYNMNDYKFYKAITSSSQRAWSDPYNYGSAGTYYLNEYANGGVSATFSEGTTSVASTVDYIDTSSTDTYYVNYTNHSKTQIAEITGTYNDGNFVSSPYGIKLNPGETRSFEINKSNYSKLAKDNYAANFTFEYTLSNVYASDEVNASLAKFIQPTYIGLWNESSYSKSGTTFSLNNIGNLQVTFQTTEGILETVSTPSGKVDHASVEYRYYIDNSVANNSWEKTGLRFYMTETNNSRVHFQNKNKTAGTMRFSGPITNTSTASLKMADFAFGSVTENFVYNVSATATYNNTVTPTWEPKTSDSYATFYNDNPAWVRFGGTTFDIDPSADNQYATILLSDMLFNDYYNYQAKFSASIDVYAVNKAELRKYVRETLLDFAPMSLRYNTTAFETYQNKLASAMNVLADQKTTQKAVTNALAELKSAVAALQTTDNLINQVDELTHIQFVDDVGSQEAARIDTRYVLIPLGEHTVPANTAFIGNGKYKDATNKKSNLTTNYAKTDTAIETLKYYYWNIEFAEYDENRSVVDATIDSVNTALANFDDSKYTAEFKKALEDAKAGLEAIDQNDGTDSPALQSEIDAAISTADNLIAHLGVNMRAHQWIEDDNGVYVVEKNEDTHWYTCSICGYELVYNHYFEYEKIDEAKHKATCVTSGTDEGCGYSVTEDHIWVEGETVASTCTTQGYTNYSCACGATKKDNYQSLKEHADVNPLDHNCDVCGDKLSDCADNNNDHKCDVCGATLSECADGNNDHKCDVCGNKLSDCADGNNDHNCDVCGDKLSDCTWGAPVLTTMPTETTDGQYTYTCEICGGKKYVAVKRENYSAYDEAIKKAEELLENEDLTQAAKDSIEAAIEEAKKLDQQLPADVVVDGETIIDNNSYETIKNATDALNNVLNGIVDGDGNINDESKKPDSTAAEEAVAKAEALEEKIELPDDVKTKIDDLRTELNGILEEISKDDEATEAEYKDELKKVEDAANAILEKYAACEKDGHKFGAEVIATYPVYDEASDTWSKGTYTKTCEVCGYVKTVAYDRANYEAYDKAVADLNSLLANENITAEAKAEINKVLTDNAIRYDLMTPDQSIVDAAVAKFVAEYNKLTDENGNLKDEYKKPDSTAAEEAVENAEGLKETVENLPQEDEAAIDDLRTELDKILEEIEADENPTDAEYQDRLDAIEEAAKDILDKYADCSDGHAWVEIDLARPTKNDDGTWNNGTYTYECENCKATKTEPAVRAIYTEYDNAKAALEALLEDATLTDAAKAEIENVLDTNVIADDRVISEQPEVDAAAAALKAKLEKLTDENGNLKDEYKKPDSTAAEEAVENAEGLKETVENLPQEDEAAIDNLRTELDKILEEIKADENPTDAEYQDRLDAIEEAAKDILEKYADCSDGHAWVEIDLARPTKNDDGTWNNGTYTYECENCKATKTEPAVRAIYTEYDNAKAALEELLEDTTLTDAAKDKITAALEANKIADDRVISEQPEVDAAADALKTVLAELTDNEGKLKDEYQKPDYKAWEEAEKAYDALDKTNVKAEIIAEANNLKDEIAGKQADDTLTQATATQDDIDAATKRLNEIITGINDGSLKNPADLSEAEELLEEAKDKAENNDVVDGVDEDIKDIEEKLEALEGATADKQGEVEALEDQLEEIIAGIEDGSLVKPDYTAYNAAVNAYNKLADVMTAEDKAAVEEIKAQITAIPADGTKADYQDDVDEATDKIVAINSKYGDCANGNHIWSDEGVLTTRPTKKDDGTWNDGYYTYTCNVCGATKTEAAERAIYTEYDKAKAALEELLEDTTLTDAAKAEIEAVLANNAIDENLVTAEQPKVDAAVAALKVELEKLTDDNGNLKDDYKKPDYSAWEEAEKAYDALDKTNVKTEIITEAEALKAEIAAKEANETLTQATATQDDIDDATARLNEIITGINDGSLRDPDYSAVENKINEAKGNDNLNKDTQDKIKEIEDKLQEIKDKTEPEANAKDDQDDVDALETQLDEILKDIADGTATAPDYTEWDKAEDKYDALDKTNVPEGLVTEATNLKATIDALKADDTANAKDDQQAIDDATAELNEIIAEINGILTEKPDFKDYDASHDAYEQLVDQYGDKIKDSVADDVAALDTIVEGVRTDDTATKIEDQDTIDDAKTQLDAIIAGIVDGSLIKDANYDSVDQTLADAKDKAENNDVINGVKEEIDTIEGLIDDLKVSGNKDQDIVDNYEDRLEEIIAGIDAGTLVKPDYTEAYKDLADATTKAETNDVIDGVKDDIKDIKDALDAIKNDPTSTKADDQDDVDALEKELEDIIAGIKDGSLIKPDYTDAETAIENAENTGSLTDDDKAIIEELKEKLDEIKNDPTSNNKEDQGAVNEIKDTVQNIINKYADCENGNHNWGAPVLTKDPTADAQGEYTETCGTCGATQITKVDRADYSKFDTVVGQLTGLLNTENLTDEAKTAINNALAKAEELDKNLPADVTTVNGKEIKGGQDKIDALVSELEKVVADTNTGIGNGKLIKPDYTNWDAAEGTYNDLDKKNVKVDILEEVAELKNTINGLKGDPTANKADDQITVNEAAARLNEIIAGIKDGSLRNPDYAEADKDLADATVKAETNDVIDGVKDDIKDIKDALDAIKNDPTSTKADDQDDVDALEDALEDIIAGIEDGSLVKPDYSDADKAIADAEKDIDNGGKLSEEDAKALEELKKQLDEIKNDPSSNKKDDQAAVDSIKSDVQQIVSRYSECAKGNHKYYVVGSFDPTCTEKGYTLYRCEVCGKTYKADFVDATGHTDANDDGTCDICGATGLYDGCACLCHNNHWFWRIVYLIFRIIWKVFKIHPTCPCGRVHY